MKLIDIAVRRPVTVWMVTLAIILFGLVSLSRLDVSLLPELSYPTLTIRTAMDGAAPNEVEQLVTKRIEGAVSVVKGVRRVTSVSKAGQSDVILEFEWGSDMDFASVKVREKLDSTWLPLDIQKPVVLRFNPSLAAIMRYGLSYQGSDTDSHQSAKATRLFAEQQIKRKLESIAGVASVKVGGGLENQIQVLVDQQKISQFNVSIEQIIQRLKAENINLSGGRVKDSDQEFLVRTLNQFTDLSQIRDLYIATFDGKNIRLGDIAEVSESHKDPSASTRFNAQDGVEIAIYKEGDANSVEVATAVRARIAQLRTTLPENLSLQLNYDQSRFISLAIAEVKTAGIVGGLLAMLVLYLFLKNVWPTVIVSISIPVSIIATFNLMYNQSVSLNIMSLGGIALAIGLLVDNSIVVLENIARHKAQGKPANVSATQGSKEVSMAIVASTLTSIAVFFPLVFVDGIAGQLFSDQALTVTFALAASLIVALTLIPMLAAKQREDNSANSAQHLFQDQKQTEGEIQTQIPPQSDQQPVTPPSKFTGLALLRWPVTLLKGLFRGLFYTLPLALTSCGYLVFNILCKLLSWIFTPLLRVFDALLQHIETSYLALLKGVLSMRLTFVAAIICLSGATVLLLPKIGVELLPDMAQGEFFVEIRLPNGSQLQQTDAILLNMAEHTQQLASVARTYSLAGSGSLTNANSEQGGQHWGKLNVVMQPATSAEHKSQVQHAIRDFLQQQAGVQYKFGQPDLFTFSTPLAIHIFGYELEDLQRISQQVQQRLADHSRFADVSAKLQAGHPELNISFDHNKLAQLGLSAPAVSKLVAANIGGELAGKFSIQDRRVDIVVKALDEQRDSIEDIAQIIVNPGAQYPVSLDVVADLAMATGPSEIRRIEQQRVAVVSANIGYGDLGEASLLAQGLINDIPLPNGVRVEVAGQNQDMQRSFSSLQMALLLAVFLVYVIMASQFESLLHPLLILFTVPLACAGSIIGLYVTQTHLSVVVFIGLIMLAGIVVNNAIVLIDRINQLREEGLKQHAAIIASAKSRLRPIFMTTLTTSLGLLPMAFGVGEGGEMRAPMAITVIFGLLFATVLTLLFIPAIYSLCDQKHRLRHPVPLGSEQSQTPKLVERHHE